MARLPRPLVLLAGLVAALVVVPPVLVQTASLAAGDTVLLPGALEDGAYVVPGAPQQVSYALDVRNDGAAPVSVQGLAAPGQGPYDARPGRGGPGGGLPEQPSFAPFRLWPGQSRLVVVHLTRTGPPAAVEIGDLRLSTRVLGVARELTVPLPADLRVLP